MSNKYNNKYRDLSSGSIPSPVLGYFHELEKTHTAEVVFVVMCQISFSY